MDAVDSLTQASAIASREEAQPTTDSKANHGHRSEVAMAVLGELEVRVDGRSVNLGGPTPRRLLLHLVLRRNQVVTLDELIEELWPEPPVHPEKALHVLVSRVRASLGAARDRLSSRAGGYRLELSDSELDLARAAAMEAKASTLLSASRFDDAATIAAQALDLWSGSPPMALYNLDALMGEATRIEELRVQLHHLQIEADIHRGKANRAVGLLEVLVREHPLRERFWAQLMRALYATGRQGDALATFLRARGVLLDELGVEPGPELCELQRLMLAQEPVPRMLDAGPQPAALRTDEASVPASLAGIPAALDDFIARPDEFETLEQLIGSHRLVTLTGPGGVGKTRLALELARKVAHRYPGGAGVVDLSSVRDPGLVLPLIEQSCGVSQGAGVSLMDRLRRRLSGSAVLLVLDNFEQVLPAATELAQLLTAAETLTVVATSRAPLRIRGEHQYAVEPLAVVETKDAGALTRPEQNPALAMFVNRARAAGRELGEADVGLATEICARVDGLPLAIELAAARVPAVGMGYLLAQLDHRLPALADGPRDLPDRHRTLEGAIEWSFELLGPDEQAFFARLTALGSRFSSASATAVAGDGEAVSGMRLLQRLIEHSLVMPMPCGTTEQRYRMLETIREFAATRLTDAEASDVHQRALQHWRGVTAEADEHMTGERQSEWIERYEADLDSIRVTLSATIAGLPPPAVFTALEIVCDLRRFWDFTGRTREARRWLEALLAIHGHDADERLLARALNHLGTTYLFVGEHMAAEPHLRHALNLRRELGAVAEIAGTLSNLALVHRHSGELDEMRRLLEESVDMSRQAGDRWGAAASLGNLAVSALESGDFAGAVRWYEEALPEFQAMGDTASVAIVLDTLGHIAAIQADYERAEHLLANAVELAREAGNRHGELSTQFHLTDLAIRRGTLGVARARASACLAQASETGDAVLTVEAVELLAQVDAAEGRHRESALLLGAAQGERNRQGWAIRPHDRLSWHGALTNELRRELGDELLIRLLADGAVQGFQRTVESQVGSAR
jgi:predicted ATPase/DNA-binding SARP family transcriptional activator